MGMFSKKAKGTPAQAEDVPAAKPENRTATRGTVRRVLVRPQVSEKAAALEPAGTYAFVVRDDATKTLVKEEVERRYGVKVARVNIVRHRGARRFFRGTWHDGTIEKKALVTLAGDARINLK